MFDFDGANIGLVSFYRIECLFQAQELLAAGEDLWVFDFL